MFYIWTLVSAFGLFIIACIVLYQMGGEYLYFFLNNLSDFCRTYLIFVPKPAFRKCIWLLLTTKCTSAQIPLTTKGTRGRFWLGSLGRDLDVTQTMTNRILFENSCLLLYRRYNGSLGLCEKNWEFEKIIYAQNYFLTHYLDIDNLMEGQG